MLTEYTQNALKSIAQTKTPLRHKLLRQCVSRGSVADFNRLIDAGFEINTPNQYGITMLMMATQYNRIAMVKALLKAGAKVNPQDSDGNTALIRASRSGHTEIVKLLLSVEGIDINQCNNDGFTAVRLALHNEKKDIANLLIQVGADTQKFQPKPIQEAQPIQRPLLNRLIRYLKPQHYRN